MTCRWWRPTRSIFADRSMFEAHDALLCIAGGSYVGEAERRRAYAGAPFQVRGGDAGAVRRSAGGDRQHAGHRPALRLHARRRASRSCRHSRLEDGSTEAEELRRRAADGLEHRLAFQVWTPEMDEAGRVQAAKPYRERLEFELDVIEQMGFPGYFLIVADFIQWAKDQGIPGRAGPRLGRRLGGRLVADHHRPRSAALGPAVRAVPQSRTRVDARLRHRLLRGPARRGDPLRPAEIRQRPRGADHHLRQAAGARGAARCRPRAADALWPGRPHLQDGAEQPGQSGHAAAGDRGRAAAAADAGDGRSRRPADRHRA